MHMLLYMHIVSSKPVVSAPCIQYVCATNQGIRGGVDMRIATFGVYHWRPDHSWLSRWDHDGIMMGSCLIRLMIRLLIFEKTFSSLQWWQKIFSRKFELCQLPVARLELHGAPLCRPDSALRPWSYASWFWFSAEWIVECWGWGEASWPSEAT